MKSLKPLIHCRVCKKLSRHAETACSFRVATTHDSKTRTFCASCKKETFHDEEHCWCSKAAPTSTAVNPPVATTALTSDSAKSRASSVSSRSSTADDFDRVLRAIKTCAKSEHVKSKAPSLAPTASTPAPVPANGVASWGSFAATEHERVISTKTAASWAHQRKAIEESRAAKQDDTPHQRFKEIFIKTTRTIDGTLTGRRVKDSVETTTYKSDGTSEVTSVEGNEDEIPVCKKDDEENEVRPVGFLPPHLKHSKK